MPNNIDNTDLDKSYDAYLKCVEAFNRELKELREYKRRVRESYINLMQGNSIPVEIDGVFHIDADQLRKHRDAIMGDEVDA